ncbi:MAG TPA: hypothetical protein VHA82_03705 [Ramlibacter sp.]|uniref:hypothetical protein n=1 Tax=Ramlibacter sp. TaxID=1917967 RepID=UPI002CCE375F|nr:hypothetical protein [Ramlibacter sp.]HVZ42894.1 hypothetical protein [Ramlibacter sp.]
MRTKAFTARLAAWLDAAAALALALVLSACGSGGGVDTSVPGTPLAGFWVAAPGSGNDGFVFADATGYMVGQVSRTDPQQKVDAMFDGHAALQADNSWTIGPADIGYRIAPAGALSSVLYGTGTTTITGSVQAGVRLVVNVPPPPLPAIQFPQLTLSYTPPDPAFATASKATLQGLYMHGSQGIEFAIDANGHIVGQINDACHIIADTIITSDTSPVYTFQTTLQGPGCPGTSNAPSKFLGYLRTAHQPAGAEQGDAVLQMAALIDNDLVMFDAVRVTNPNAHIPDGSLSPVGGFIDPPVAAVTNLIGGEYQGFEGPSATLADTFAPAIQMLVDSSGRFIATVSSTAAPQTPNAEDVIMGTFNVTGAHATSIGAVLSHRAASSSTFVTGTVTVSATMGPDFDTRGNPRMHLTLGSATQPLVASDFTLAQTYVGTAPNTAALPNGGWFNGDSVRIDGQTGRIAGLYALNCVIEGTLHATDPNRNIYRLRAAFSGTGCPAAGVPQGVGEFLGYKVLGATPAEGPSLRFFGLVNGQLALPAILYPSPLY